jgi:hypothetical protein
MVRTGMTVSSSYLTWFAILQHNECPVLAIRPRVTYTWVDTFFFIYLTFTEYIIWPTWEAVIHVIQLQTKFNFFDK